MKIYPAKNLSQKYSLEENSLTNDLITTLVRKKKTITSMENDYFSEWASLRLRVIEKTILLFEMLVLLMSMISFELSKMNDSEKNQNEVLYFLHGINIFSILFFIFHTFCIRDFLISKNIMAVNAKIYKTHLIYNLILNIGICFIHPNLFFNHSSFSFTLHTPEVNADFIISANDIMIILVIFRFTYFLILAKNFSSLNSNSSNRICQMVGFKNGFSFLIKVYLKNFSFLTISFISIYLLFLSAYIFRILEYDNPVQPFYNLFNSVWYVMVQFSTVAYGDYIIQGDLSRMIGIPIIIIGLLNTNLIIYVVMTVMSLTRSEKQAYQNFQMRENIDNLTNLRIKLITQFFRIACLNKKEKTWMNDLKLKYGITLLAKTFRDYKELRNLIYYWGPELGEGVLNELNIIEEAMSENFTKLEDIKKIGRLIENILEKKQN